MAVMSNMNISHQQIVISKIGFSSSSLRPAVYGYSFSNDVFTANGDLGFFVLILKILRFSADAGKRINGIFFSQGGPTIDHHM